MLEFCKMKWSHNEKVLKGVFKNSISKLKDCTYKDLVEYIIKYILNEDIGIEEYDKFKFSLKNIHVIDDGEYQGTSVYIISMDTYQPGPSDYIITYNYYGSCSGCDTLLRVQSETENNDTLMIDSYMDLCRHLVCRVIKPYFSLFQNEDVFKIAEE